MSKLLSGSSFDPSGNYYASVVTALDTHRIRTQSTNNSSLANAFSLEKGNKITSISWALSAEVESSNKKKRRVSLSQKHDNFENEIISIGLNKGSILQYSPSANQIIGKLENPNASSINDYHFSTITNSGWSVDSSQNVIEWDLILFKPKSQFKFKESINLIRVINYQDKPHLLLASHSVYLIEIETQKVVKTFPGHITPIHTLLLLNDGINFITAASGDRFINIYSLEGSSSVLVAQSDVLKISINNNNNEIISVITEDGFIEIFKDFLKQDKIVKSNNKRKSQQSKLSDFKVYLKRPNLDVLKIEDCFVLNDFILITWLEDQNVPYFEKIKLSNLKESNELIKDLPKIKVKEFLNNDIAAAKNYNENSIFITSGDNLMNLDNKEKIDPEEESDEEDGPSLAEKMELLKVENTQPKKKHGKATTGSLVVILTQALRSSDHSLLDTVLSSRNEEVLKSTIERLDTTLAILLLERLAERIARNTNKQGQLNLWVKWVMIIHGGYLINVPNLSKSLSSLHSTLARRSKTLPRLLELQGRLDVLYSNFEINKEEEFIEEEDSDVEYIEELDGDEDLDVDIDDDEISSESEEEDLSEDEKMLIEKLAEDEMQEEFGFSDEEINGEINEESESEDEQELLRQRIEKLKSKQKK